MAWRALKPILGAGFVLALLLALWLAPVDASSLLTSRVNQLEFQLRSLQSQISRIQAQLPGLGDSVGGRSPAPPIEPIPPGDPTLEAQFDNLAILVIELRDRIAALEAQVAAIESE
ncbi:MAG: hypothetical protein F6J97_15005 [Leptolyngbya sp. SIO4C1]|nr:hypothetical protein [Leptolyngbya sp. SIO4C1]